MITYRQTDGLQTRNGIILGSGYSGFGPGLNNPAMEAIPDVGPIPKGFWRIVRWDDQHAEKGPCVAVLEPVGHNAHNRTGFLLHGDNAAMNHTASHGCIVDVMQLRHLLRATGDMELEVI